MGVERKRISAGWAERNNILLSHFGFYPCYNRCNNFSSEGQIASEDGIHGEGLPSRKDRTNERLQTAEVDRI